MADQEIQIDTLVCEGTKYIVIDKYTIELDPGDSINFTNNLNGNPDAKIQFYDLDAGGKISSPAVSDFCGDSTGSSLTVPGNGSVICTVSKYGNHQYVIEAGTGGTKHESLDPVIIIDEPDFFPLLPLFIAAVAGAVAGAAFTRIALKRKGN